MTPRSLLHISILALGLVAASISAQDAPSAAAGDYTVMMRDCGDRQGGVIAGRLVYEDERLSRSGRGIDLLVSESTRCMASGLDDGTFVFFNVPPGRPRLRVAPLFISAPDSLFVDVIAGDTAHVEVWLGYEDAMADCIRDEPSCREILAVPVPSELTQSEREEFRFWQAALALARVGQPSMGDRVICLGGEVPTTAVYSAFGAFHSNLVPSEECSVRGRIVVHDPTDRPAMFLTVAVVDSPFGSIPQDVPDGPILEVSQFGRTTRCGLVTGLDGRQLGRCWTASVS